MRLFSSVKDEDFVERRAQAMLAVARGQKESLLRAEWLELYVATADSLHGEDGATHQRRAAWAPTIVLARCPTRPEWISSSAGA